jgi:hypothetical protein
MRHAPAPEAGLLTMIVSRSVSLGASPCHLVDSPLRLTIVDDNTLASNPRMQGVIGPLTVRFPGSWDTN